MKDLQQEQMDGGDRVEEALPPAESLGATEFAQGQGSRVYARASRICGTAVSRDGIMVGDSADVGRA